MTLDEQITYMEYEWMCNVNYRTPECDKNAEMCREIINSLNELKEIKENSWMNNFEKDLNK